MKERESDVRKIRIEVQVYVPRLEPAAPIRLADRNHAHYPSRHLTILKKYGSMMDFKNTRSDPHESHQMLNTLDAPNPWCALTLFPTPRATSQAVGTTKSMARSHMI